MEAKRVANSGPTLRSSRQAGQSWHSARCHLVGGLAAVPRAPFWLAAVSVSGLNALKKMDSATY